MYVADRAALLARCRELAEQNPLHLGVLREFAATIEPSAELLDSLRRPDPSHPYGRNVLLATDTLEVMVATWTPGTPCAPHDHGGSVGAVRVLQGTSRHTVWAVQDGALQARHTHDAPAGEVLACGPDLIHSMGAKDGDGQMLTLHLYTRAIDHMIVYDADEGDTYTVEGSCGAWIPHDQPAQIRKKTPGVHKRCDLPAD